MATAYYPDIKWYYWDGDSWEDISGYVLTKNGVSGSWGMRSNKYTDRLAATGEMRMLLDNADGVFDPDDASVLTGWAINTKVKMVVSYDGVDYVRFYGKVGTLKFSDPSTHEHTAQVVVSDWMGYAYKKTLTDRSIETYKSGGELASEIITAVGQTPLATNIAVGDYEFPAAFDGVTTTTKAATELNKIVLSENGYFYNRHDKVNGETVTFEAESTRNGLRTVSQLPKLQADCGFVLKAGSATDYVLLAGSATDKLVLNETQDAHINGTAQRYERTHGENILNKVTVTAYPKRVDTEEQTIYSLGTPLMLAPGETKTITVKYQNATTKESCNAITELCSQPVATTDYLMNRNKAGTSTNLTTSLAVSVVFHTASADVTFTSTSAYTGYVTRLYLKGYGVYQDASIKAEASDSTSQTAYGVQELNIEQQYQRETIHGEHISFVNVLKEKDPRTKLEKITMIANTSSTHMFAFLSIDIGDMVQITESDLNLADYYYVNGIEFNVAEGNVITFSWILCEILTISEYFTDIQIDIDVPIDYGSPRSYAKITNPVSILNERYRTAIVSVYFDVPDDAWVTSIVVFRITGYLSLRAGGLQLSGSVPDDMVPISFQSRETSDDLMARNTWYRIAVSWDALKRPPCIYLNGELKSLSDTSEENVTPEDETGEILRFGGAGNCEGGTVVTKIKRAFFYNRILSAEEIAEDAADNGCITDGLVLIAPAVITENLANYIDQDINNTLPIYDKINGYIGNAYDGKVVAREIT